MKTEVSKSGRLRNVTPLFKESSFKEGIRVVPRELLAPQVRGFIIFILN